MSDSLDQLRPAEVVLVTFGDHNLDLYRAKLGLGFPVLADHDRAVYGAYELGRAGYWTVWGPKAWRAYAPLLRAGQRTGLPTEDTRQLGGDILIDTAGRISWQHRSTEAADRPSVDVLAEAVAAIGA